MRVTMMRNIETFPSKQMYPYLSLVKRKVAEFYHNIDRRRYLVWFKWLIFITFSGQLMVSLQVIENISKVKLKIFPDMECFRLLMLQKKCSSFSKIHGHSILHHSFAMFTMGNTYVYAKIMLDSRKSSTWKFFKFQMSGGEVDSMLTTFTK